MTSRTPQIDKARALLGTPAEPVANPLGALGAAALAATAALLMAGVMVLGPGVALDHPAPPASGF